RTLMGDPPLCDARGVNREPGSKSSSAATQSIYFHLLFEDELIELRPVLEALGRRRDEVLRQWYQLYHVHFAERRTLSEPAFLQIHGPDIDATSSTLSAGDFDRFVTEVRAVGERLAARGVPFAEVVASMHFFE